MGKKLKISDYKWKEIIQEICAHVEGMWHKCGHILS